MKAQGIYEFSYITTRCHQKLQTETLKPTDRFIQGLTQLCISYWLLDWFIVLYVTYKCYSVKDWIHKCVHRTKSPAPVIELLMWHGVTEPAVSLIQLVVTTLCWPLAALTTCRVWHNLKNTQLHINHTLTKTNKTIYSTNGTLGLQLFCGCVALSLQAQVKVWFVVLEDCKVREPCLQFVGTSLNQQV